MPQHRAKTVQQNLSHSTRLSKGWEETFIFTLSDIIVKRMTSSIQDLGGKMMIVILKPITSQANKHLELLELLVSFWPRSQS